MDQVERNNSFFPLCLCYSCLVLPTTFLGHISSEVFGCDKTELIKGWFRVMLKG